LALMAQSAVSTAEIAFMMTGPLRQCDRF